jgi:predicted amidohydrolase YtcJ
MKIEHVRHSPYMLFCRDEMMKRPDSLALMIVFLWCCGAMQSASAQDSAPPTLIIRNAKVYTPSGWQEAVAVRNERIVAVGTTAEINKLASRSTRVVDLQGRTLLPGLHESHAHPMVAGTQWRECSLQPGANAKKLLDRVAACVARARPGQWITGGGWDMTQLSSPPTRQMLDSVAPNNPVMLMDFSYHSRWVNTQALQIAGITRATPNPDGGVILRDEQGEPSGIVSENAAALIEAHVPPPDAATSVADLRAALHTMLSFGITSLVDAAADDRVLAAYHTLDRSDELKQRVTGCKRLDADSMLSYEQVQYSGKRFMSDCIKLLLDGVPLTPRTAAVLVPYVGMEHDELHGHGLLIWKQDRLNQFLIKADKAGYQVKMHAAGDGAVRQAVTAIAATREANGYLGRMHSIAHVGWLGEGDAALARKVGAALEFSPFVWFTSPGNDVVRGVVGDERMKGWYPVREAIVAGAVVLAGSDWPVVSSVNPWLGMETLVTRKAPGNEGPPLAPAHAITLQEAFAMYTVNAATYEGKRQQVGAIEPGLLADLIVTDRNPFAVPIGDVHNTQVVQVFIDGVELSNVR